MKVGFGAHQVELGGSVLKDDLRNCNTLLDDPIALWDRLQEDGYLLVRQLHDPELVLAARAAVIEFMGGAIHPDADPMNAVVHSGQALPRLLGNRAIKHSAPLSAILENPTLFDFFASLFGEPARTFEYKWLRAVQRDEFTGTHFDVIYMGAGSQRLFSIWTPLGRVMLDLGDLAICTDSQWSPGFEKMRQPYGRSDADRDKYGGWFSDDPLEVVRSVGGQWRTTTHEPGDVIVFSMYTLHASTTNLTDRWRISCVTRFQPISDPVDKRWIGDQPHGENQLYTDQPAASEEMRTRWGV